METISTLFFHSDIIRNSIFMIIFSSFVFGIIGTYVVAKRISYIAGALSHTILGGIGFGVFLTPFFDSSWPIVSLGAFFSAVVAVFIIVIVYFKFKGKEDTLINAMWSIGLAMGPIFIAISGSSIDPMSYLFGNMLLISDSHLCFVILFLLFLLFIVRLFYYQFMYVSFDEEFSFLRGISPLFFLTILFLLIAITVLILTQIVGIILAQALLVLPAATAEIISKKMWQMMIVATIISILSGTGGLFLSFIFDLPSGPVIVLFSAFIYLMVMVLSRVKLLHIKG